MGKMLLMMSHNIARNM